MKGPEMGIPTVRRTRQNRTLPLVANQTLVLERTDDGNLLTIVGADGQVRLSVQITPAGPILRLEGSGLMIQTTGDLAIDAQRIALHGREGVAISSGANASIQVAGELTTEARSQNISAVLGDVSVHANDDVKLNGERVKLNCSEIKQLR
jgi:hypothetical protein